MKKWITVDAFIVAFFSAMGYGFGYSIPAALNAPVWLCFVICIAAGMAMEKIAETVIYSRFTQEKTWRKLIIFAVFIAIFFVADFISRKCLEASLIEDLKEEYGFVLLFAVVGFAVSLGKRYYRTAKTKKRYGKGEKGFRFNEQEKAYIEELNQKNAELTGEYDPALAAKTRTGIYVGEKDGSVLSFKGIPYANAPRWKAPERLPDSDKVHEAKHFGASAIQVNYEGNILSSHRQSEDCLTLNICTAELDPKEKKPVVVYFHGGDFSYGGSADPLWEVSGYVKESPDVVAVSFNYRLGLLGFIDFSAVPGGEEYPDTANLGLMDQIAALEWVKENIAAFGGDADEITLMGDSAGGISIGLLASLPCVKGLFRKAILFSGTPYSTEPDNAVSAELGTRLLKAAGAASMKELLALPEERLVELTQKLKEYLTAPCRDGRLISADVFTALENGAAKDISFILHTARDNASVYSASIGRGFSEKVLATFTEKILELQTPEAKKSLKTWLNAETKQIGKAKAEARFLDLWMDQVCVYHFAKLLHSGGGSVRLVYWDVDAVIENLGVGDVNIVNTVLGTPEAAEAYGNVVNENIRAILQSFLTKAVHGEELALYNNEIDGVNAIDWETFPSILAVSKNKIQVQPVKETLKDAFKLLRVAGYEA